MSKKSRRRRRQAIPQPTSRPHDALEAVDTFEILALHADARDRCADLVDLTTEATQASTQQAEATAKSLVEAAEAQAAQVRDEAERRAQELHEGARQAGAAVEAAAAAQAELIREEAGREAAEIHTAAEAAGLRLVEEATAQGQKALETAQDKAAAEIARGRREAEGLSRSARRNSEEATSQLRAAEREAQRIREEASSAADRLRQQAAADIAADQERASRDAGALRTSAAAVIASAKEQASSITEKAARREAAAQQTEEEADQLLNQAQDAWERATSRTARRQERRDLRQQGRHRRAEARREHRRAKDRPTLTHRLAQGRQWARDLVRNQARRVLVAGPILAPMAVAWWSQTDYAQQAFGWKTIFAIGFAAAWELTTAFTGWMYHQARQQGDAGTVYRIMTWIFASGAAAMNYAHHCGPAGEPTQAAVAFGTMSIVGMVLWELYASLVHRQYLREQGLVSRARPKIGMIRWIRFPVRSWTAWSLTIENASLSTLERAWNAAGAELADRNAARSGLALHRIVIPRVPAAGPHHRSSPGTVPAFHLTWNAPHTARSGAGEYWNGTGRAQWLAREKSAAGAERHESLAPPGRSATEQGVSNRTTFRSGAPERTGTQSPSATAPAARAPERGGTPAAPERRALSSAPEDSGRSGSGARNGARTSGAERPENEVVLNDKERAAVERLLAKGEQLSKRTISSEVRSAGEGIADDRALEIANYFNALAKSQPGQRFARV
ncbi:hypothetical protein C9F11_42925 (plasmid) [Streptomyces sp. YIM 121038]|uniref:DUF2637 domain-containing protein n=1 Tax=Streptomyces sp. YIM 121038 TaxID=2136401 RepID=UPI001110F971|nr:DUF2637 domain-containing protein [Streptomyces sp. YIM 121038]QCX82165.1 hypothetical protein C9F11_42925 [Streptomyces sp. YIM 121038]